MSFAHSSPPSQPPLSHSQSSSQTAGLSSSQRSAIQQLIAFTQCSERTAAKFLRASGWNVAAAADSYYSSSSSSPAPSSSSGPAPAYGAPPSPSTAAELNKIFDQFREANDPQDTMGVNGSMRFLQAIGVDLAEPTVLAIAEVLNAPTMGEFSREGFVAGWARLGCKSVESMRATQVPLLRASLEGKDEVTFKRVYMFTFRFALASPGAKSLPREIAIEYWRILLPLILDGGNDRGRGPGRVLLDSWVAFLLQQADGHNKRGITKDTWNCMYDFVHLARRDPGLEGYDLDGAWPTILDDFVQYWRKQRELS